MLVLKNSVRELSSRTEFFLSALALAVIAGFSMYTTWSLIADSDIWWHLAAGRWMAEHKTFLFTDPFSVTAYGAPWTNVHWLFQRCMYGVYQLAGLSGLVAIKALLFSAAIVVLASVMLRRTTAGWTALIVVVIAYALRFLILDRPLVFSLVLLAFFIFIIERSRATGNAQLLWWLVPAQLVWVNSQALFVLGPVVVLCYAAGDALGALGQRRAWHFLAFEDQANPRRMQTYTRLIALVLPACLVNPYGYRVFGLAGKLFGRILPAAQNVFSSQIAENIPPLLAHTGTPGIGIWMAVLGLVGLASFLLTLRSFSLSRFLLFGAFLFLAGLAERNVPLFFCVLVPVIAGNLNYAFSMAQFRDTCAGRLLRTWNNRIGWLLLSVVGILLIVRIQTERRHNPADNQLAPFRFPVGAVDFLRHNRIAGNLFNSDRHGGYIIWQLFPAKRCFMDGRFSLRSRAFLEGFVALLDHPENFERYFRHYAITHAMVPIDQQQRYVPLAIELYRSGWCLVYLDGSDAVFVRADQWSGPVIDLAAVVDKQKLMGDIMVAYGNNEYLRSRAESNLDNYMKILGVENKL
jgi:hypothetical protein